MFLVPDRAFSNVFNLAENFLIRRIPADIPQTVKMEGWIDLLYGGGTKKDRLLLISSFMFPKHWKKNNLNFVNIEVKSARNGPRKGKLLFHKSESK
jgi:hypothetical protein